MAAGSGAIRAGKAFIELFTEDSAVGRGLRAVSAKVNAWGASVNQFGSSLGSSIGSTFKVISKGAKLAGFAVAGMGAGLLAAAKLFSDADRSTMTGEQAGAADRMRESFAALKDGAVSLNNTLMTALQPGISAVVDIVRVGFSAFKEWIATHQELIQGVNDFLGGIRDALSAGDVALAASILWAGIKTAWAAGIVEVMTATVEWKTAFQQTASEAFLGVQKWASDMWNAITDGATMASDFMVDVFQSAVGAVARAFAYVGEKVGLLEEGTAKMLAEDLGRAKEDRQAKRVARDTATAKERAKAEEEFGQTVLDANKAIADANMRAIEEAKSDLERRKQELQGLQDQAKANAKPIESQLDNAKKAIDEKPTVAGAFAGGRDLGQLTGDRAGKSIAENTKKTAEGVKQLVDLQKGMTPGLAVT